MKKRTLITAAAAAILLSGCLLSGTFSFSIRLTNLEADFTNGYIKETVALADKSTTWEDHEDEVAKIEALYMDAIVVNNAQSATTLGIYVAADSNLVKADLASQAVPVLTGYTVPAQTTDTLTVSEALPLLHLSGDNFLAIQNLLKSGQFTVYASSSLNDASVSIALFNLHITFTTQ